MTDEFEFDENIKKLKRLLRWFFILFVVLIFITMVTFLVLYLSIPDVSDLLKHNPETTALIEYRKEQAENQDKKYHARQSWVRFSKIPKLFRQSVRITEDASFYQHEGLDYLEIKESFKKNLEEGKYVRGASTITQQLAKNLYLSPRKSIWRKIRETWIARRLENTLGKNRIFHLYLNVIEFGPGIFGVQEAARYYYKRDVDRLTLEQIIRLTAIIPKPLVENPKKNSKWLLWKCRWILEKLKRYGYISPQRYKRTLKAFD